MGRTKAGVPESKVHLSVARKAREKARNWHVVHETGMSMSLFTKKEPRKNLYHHHGQWHCDWVHETGKSTSIVDQGRDFTVVMVNGAVVGYTKLVCDVINWQIACT
jgi:hypothetical protein